MKIRVSELKAYKMALESVANLQKVDDPENKFAYAVYKNYKKLETLTREYDVPPSTPEFEAYRNDINATMEELHKKETPPTREEVNNTIVEVNSRHPEALKQRQDILDREIEFDIYTCKESNRPNMSAAQMDACEFMISEIDRINPIISL